ncbi:sugar transferase [Methylosinus sp. Ce-a6]|uniref:sugar transferase n=1 Tax=Methylosinus sp. Ce-a6 TaxID=2172005 RepID=UPI0013584C5F|nr:sugar transferase [Methylosinus sp. Ce-a6]
MRLASPASRDRIRFHIEACDLSWAIAASFIALALRDPALLEPGGFPAEIPAPYQFALLSTGCAILMIVGFRLSDHMGQFFSMRDAWAICAASACAVATSCVILFTFTRLEGVPRSTPLIFGLVLSAGIISSRVAMCVLHKDVQRERPRGSDEPAELRRVIVIGVDGFVSAAIKLTDCLSPRTTQIVAALDGRAFLAGRKIAGVSIVGGPRDIGAVIDEYAVHGVYVDQVWLSEDKGFLPSELVDEIISQCEARGVAIVGMSEALNLISSPPATSAADVDSGQKLEAPIYFEQKRLFEACVASLLFVLALPIALCVAYVVFLDVGAPILFWQQRIGRNGQKFLLYKFRTYRAPFDKNGRPVAEERRLSSIGRMIRATRLDEIPQLYNVILGHMSLIGPRPLLPHDQPDDPGRRLSVRPGVTGWAQINGGTAVTPEEKNALDVWYIKHASLRLDLEIAVGTLLVALTGEKLNGRAVDHAIGWYRREFASVAAFGPKAEEALRADSFEGFEEEYSV